jgi:hypothetical protein
MTTKKGKKEAAWREVVHCWQYSEATFLHVIDAEGQNIIVKVNDVLDFTQFPPPIREAMPLHRLIYGVPFSIVKEPLHTFSA